MLYIGTLTCSPNTCYEIDKMLKYQEEWTVSPMLHLYLLMVVWAVLQVLWPANPSASWWSSCGQWRLFVLRLLLLVSSSWLVLSMLQMQHLYMGPLLYTTSNVEFCWFYNLYIYIQLITCIRTTSRTTDVQHVISLHQIAYVQRIRCIQVCPVL
jgi:hypothetical protein